MTKRRRYQKGSAAAFAIKTYPSSAAAKAGQLKEDHFRGLHIRQFGSHLSLRREALTLGA